MALNPSIALGVRPLEVPNQLAQYSQMAQLESAQNQNQVSQMQLAQMRRDEETFRKIQAASVQHGGPENRRQIAREYINSGNPQYVQIGLAMQQKLDDREQFERVGGSLYPELFGRAPAAAAPAAPMAAAPAARPSGALGSGTFGMMPEPVNNLAPTPAAAPAAPSNALATPAGKTPDQLRKEIIMFSMSEDPRAKNMVDMLKAQLTESLKAHVLAPNATLLVGGQPTFTAPAAPPAPTQTSRLIAERAALLESGVLPTDPRIQAYDQQLAAGESQSMKMQRELQVAIANKAPPAVIDQLRRDIRNLHPGLAMQNITGVDAQGNQIVTRFAGAGGGPQGQFALQQAPVGTARAMLGLNDSDSALLFGPGGPVESGQIPVNKLNASNAKMYVAAFKANPTLNLATLTEDQLLNAARAKAAGGVQGKQALTLVDETTAQNIANGNLPPAKGPNADKIMNKVMEINPNFKASDYGLQTAAVKAFNQGIQGNKVRSLNVVMEHFNTLEKAADALQSGDVRAINTVAQFIQTQTGKPAPANFNAVKEILADEIIAAVVPGVGALADRVALKKTILASASPEQLKGVVANYKELIGGQLVGLEKQYQAGTGRDDFKSRYLTPAAVQGLAPPSASGGAGVVDSNNPLLK